MRKILIFLALSLFVYKESTSQISTTLPIRLSTVITYLGLPANSSLQDCFDNADAGSFDPTYAKTGEWLTEFRGYGASGSTTPWTDLIPNTSVINYYPKAKVSERNGLVTITGIFAFIPDNNAVNQDNLVFTIPSSIPLCTQSIEIACGQIIPGDEEVLVLYIPANTRNIRLRLRGDYPQEYYFTVTYPAI